MNSVGAIRELSELTNLRELVLMASGGTREEDSETETLKYDTLAASLRGLGNSNLRELDVYFSAPEQFWNNCFTCPHHLRLIYFTKMKTPQVPTWMAQADMLAYVRMLHVEQLQSKDVKFWHRCPASLTSPCKPKWSMRKA
jgi:hypothetical protein